MGINFFLFTKEVKDFGLGFQNFEKHVPVWVFGSWPVISVPVSVPAVSRNFSGCKIENRRYESWQIVVYDE